MPIRVKGALLAVIREDVIGCLHLMELGGCSLVVLVEVWVEPAWGQGRREEGREGGREGGGGG
jgi:hypothetical protein